MKRSILIIVLFLYALTTCKKDPAEQEKPKDPAVDYMKYNNLGKISAGGGSVTVNDANNKINGAFVEIPSGALTTETEISIKPAQGKNWFYGDSTRIFIEAGPSGTKFSSPVKIGVPYKSGDNPDSLKVYYYDETEKVWIDIPVVSVDKAKQLVIAETNHFSLFVTGGTTPFIWAQLFMSENKIQANLKMTTPLAEIATNDNAFLNYGKTRIGGFLNDYSYKFLNVGIKVKLLENTGWLSVHPVLQMKTHLWRINQWYLNDAEVLLLEDGSKGLFNGNISQGLIESYFSDQMFLYKFDDVTPVEGKKYYVELSISYISDINALLSQENYYKKTDPITISAMRLPPDSDKDGIVDFYDKQYGNLPNVPSSPIPANGAGNIPISVDLSWTCSDPDNDPLTYDVYFGATTNPTTLTDPGLNKAQLTKSGLSLGKTYYWKVVAKDNHGNSTTGPAWSFSTIPAPNQPPGQPSYTYPANNAIDLLTSFTFTWNCTDPENDPLKYDIYVSTASNPTTTVATDLLTKSYTISGLTEGGTYYWKVVAKDDHNNSTSGPIWNFTTKPFVGLVTVANFTASKTSVTKGESIQFTDQSTNNPTSWLWNFGDNTTNTAQNPSKTYITAGTYTVSLIALNNYGPGNPKTMNITVSDTGSTGETGTVDYEGVTYPWKKIGTQVWMTKNLAYLPSVSPPSQGSATDPYYYVYGYSGSDFVAAQNNSNCTTYGVLYNWPAAMAGADSSSTNPSGVRGICPSGWHLPSITEWTVLVDYLSNNGYGYQGSVSEIAKSMAAKTNWGSFAKAGTPGNDLASNNSSGFSGLPGGSRHFWGSFYNIGGYCDWWSSAGSTTHAWSGGLSFSYAYFGGGFVPKEYGFSVRCVRD